jgi:uncharacterized protein YecE (DUF72 family)
MLASYSERLPTVEINNTFYRMPKPDLLEGWRGKVASEFRFALKAPKSITHISRLKDAGDGPAHFLKVAQTLEGQLGPILFQLPPFLRKDIGVLREFLALLPPGTEPAFEFRHASWFDDEVSTALADKGAALVAGDPDEGEPLPLVATARFGYLRLRAASYDVKGLEAWHARIAAQAWDTAYIYLKHEVLGPAYAQALLALARGESPNVPAATPEQAAPPKQRKAAKKVAHAAMQASRGKVTPASPVAPASSAKQAPKNAKAAKPRKGGRTASS